MENEEKNEEKSKEKKSKKAADSTELAGWQKFTAGILLILFTIVPAIFLVSLWPDRLPAPKENIKPLYHYSFCHMQTRLAEICDTPKKCLAVSIATDTAKTDSVKKDTVTELTTGADSGKPAAVTTAAAAAKTNCDCIAESENKLWHINTILLLLVALAGFLGNMIHIATSFTNFVGAKKFESSWVLWYFVKPFTAASLAVGLYFVFRGGFLNMSDDASNINLYGVMTISLLAGLFTDRATQKLKEVFEVLFQPKETRPNPIAGKANITEVSPLEIEAGKENVIKLKGENLTDTKLTAAVNDEVVLLSDITKDGATLKYTIPDAQKDKTTFDLVVKDGDGNSAGRFSLKLKPAAPAGADTGKPDAGKEDDNETDNDNTAGADPVIKE